MIGGRASHGGVVLISIIRGDIMKAFETGKTYRLHGVTVKRSITIVKRSKCFVTVSGAYNGRLAVRSGCFGNFEFLFVPVVVGGVHTMRILCFADNEI